MPQPLAQVLAEVRADILDADRLVRAVAAGRRKGARPQFRRAELRWVDLRGGRHLKVVTYDERQAFTKNLTADDAPGGVDELLRQPYGNWHVEAVDGTTQVRVTKSGDAQVHRSTSERGNRVDRSHDRAKPRLLEPTDPFLHAVGITDAGGHVKPSKRAKYRQVEEFVRSIEPLLDTVADAAGTETVRVADLGCGNAYLTFAAYRWLERSGVAARLTGVDIKAQARDRNTGLAARLGWSGGVDFVAATIEDAPIDPAPHVVLALHACDTATDDALARAVRWRTPVIMAAPCCHHDVQRQLRRADEMPAPYGLLGRHAILRERFADTLTDALRAAILRLVGYRVEVIEFVESAHTPRNTLLRAVYTGSTPNPALIAEYLDMIRAWSIRPALADRLDDLIEPVTGPSE